ncbi:hypothetical protein JCM3774_005825 [Rhodotorula dairenensis]
MQADMTRAGHSYFGVVSSAQEAHAILEASKLGLLPRVTRRLTDEERTRFVRAGAVFVWEEEEAGIRRWTDHIKWSPSRVSGAFLTYTEVPNRGEDGLIKQSFSATDANGSKMHLIAYTSKAAFAGGSLPLASRDPLVQHMLSQRTRGGQDPRANPATLPQPTTSGQGSSSGRSPTPSSSSHTYDSSRSHSNSLSTQASSIPPSEGAAFGRSISATSANSAASDPREVSGPAHHDAAAPVSKAEEHRGGKAQVSSHPRRTESGAPLGPLPDKTSGHWYGSIHDGPVTASPTTSDFPPPTTPRETTFPYSESGYSDRQSASGASMPSMSSYSGSPPTTRASPFDSNPRQLPPLQVPAASGLPIPSAESPSWNFDTHFSPLHDADAQRKSPRIEHRGSEDERQLRLLGRGF